MNKIANFYSNQELNSNSSNYMLTIQYEIILIKDHLMKWVEKLKANKCFVVNIKTERLNTLSIQLVGLSLAIKNNAAYLPLGHNYLNSPEQLPTNEVLEILKPIFADKHIKKIVHNYKVNYAILTQLNIEFKNISFDTMLESYILNSTVGKHDLASLAKQYLQYKTKTFKDIAVAGAGKGRKKLTFAQVELEQASIYAAEDAYITLLLHETIWPKLKAEPKLKRIFQYIEMPLVPVLVRMEQVGVLIDVSKLIKLSKEIASRLIEIEKKAYILAEQEFNLASTKQLKNIFFEKLRLPILKKTPCGDPSTNEAVLEELSFIHHLPKIIIQYRSLSKIKSTYTDKLPFLINSNTKRLHTSYHQAVTSTGRLSSRDPNLQNIPVRTKEGRMIRQSFIARKGYKIMTADYSQIELRILTHLSQDKKLLHAFAIDQDIHKTTAADIFNVSFLNVTSEQRRRAKAINFGLIYGMSSFGLARQLGINCNKAKQYIYRYFERYPGVLSYIERTRKQAAEQGYVETIEGRRLYLPDINSNNPIKRKASEREAINAPMQGTAADIIKKVMIIIDKWIEKVKPDIYLLMQVHDELVFEIKESAVNKSRQKISQLMEQCVELTVKLKVDIGIGDNWDEANKC